MRFFTFTRWVRFSQFCSSRLSVLSYFIYWAAFLFRALLWVVCQFWFVCRPRSFIDLVLFFYFRLLDYVRSFSSTVYQVVWLFWIRYFSVLGYFFKQFVNWAIRRLGKFVCFDLLFSSKLFVNFKLLYRAVFG